ncbi:solute carrier family 13 (sodium-dependent dicarboxylate transporter), member 2/3/5 [Flaviramulus basaltis]|uniref:Solute carrier family 13 (Sodium-dependent dicarboxylate transporter), member 2/3/5 n=1 Tax=Flaviramulus basaltis TaxID=369401 RepID=A0A1K2IRW9_9FLAO|nr:DASS family sodium-coupled anion symporter [Flaviramulus basaltis]SFZ95119.1 solute carrier family 13 (sodium-dependent dicarboxylate transporter), member 2/3/5 [Flaviramulus basaltis]
MNLSKKKIGLFLGPILFILIKFFFHPEELDDSANAILASTVWIAVWWITEAIPISATALLPIVLFPLTEGLSLSSTTASYGHKYIFLFLGGFILAIAIEKWNLHKRIALNIIKIVGTNVNRIILGFMVATALLSMWISNTATAVMILPVGMAIITQLKDNPKTKEDENLIFGKALMLAIAYSASIGGMATLIGTPPNLVLAGVIESTYDTEITFSQWFVFGFPISIILLFVCWVYLTRFAFKFKQKEFPGGKNEIEKQLLELGKMSYEEKAILSVFSLTALAWISRSFLLVKWLPAIDDTIIAIIASIILFLIPSRKKAKPLITWEDAVKLPWGILILFGGGMALALGFDSSGLASWIGNQLTTLQGVSIFILLLVLITSVNFLTEITSNMATTAMLLPVLVSLATIINIHPYILLVSATVAASCAFMLPVATPPNAVVFGSGYLKIEDMVKKGVWMNVVSIIILTLFVYYVLPLIWSLD